jgi:hypothetical protein
MPHEAIPDIGGQIEVRQVPVIQSHKIKPGDATAGCAIDRQNTE